MYHVLYVSIAVHPLTSDELNKLLASCRSNNALQNITGMLLYKDGEFMQVLEGEKAAVQTLYARISRDPRHRNAAIILEGPIESRHFPDWSMGYRDLRDPAIIANPAYDLLLNKPNEIEALIQQGPLYLRLLQSFRYDV